MKQREFTSGGRHDKDSRRQQRGYQSRRYERSTGRQDLEEYTTGRQDDDLERRRTGRREDDLDEYTTGRRDDDLEEETTGRRDDDQERASTVSQEFSRRAWNNGISVRATSDRGDLRRQRGLAEYDRQTRQRAQIADDEDWTGVQPKIPGGNRLGRHKHHNPDSGQPEVSRSIQRHRIRTTTF